MSNKSTGPVKTHQEKLIDKAQKAIKEFWTPESDPDATKGTGKQNAEANDDQNAKLSDSNPDTAINKKRKPGNEHSRNSKSTKADSDVQK